VKIVFAAYIPRQSIDLCQSKTKFNIVLHFNSKNKILFICLSVCYFPLASEWGDRQKKE